MCARSRSKRGDWRLIWESGGDILLIRDSSSSSGGALCPKCRAPMLFFGERACCYACGMNFERTSNGLVSVFGRHSWDDTECGRTVIYDPDLGKQYYEGLSPGEVDDLAGQ